MRKVLFSFGHYQEQIGDHLRNRKRIVSQNMHGWPRAAPEFLGGQDETKNWGPYVHMNHVTLLGIREKTHERRRSHRDARLQQGHVAMEAHVASVCFKCFRRFKGMLQLFYMDVAKID